MKAIFYISIFASLTILKAVHNQSMDILMMGYSEDQTISCPVSDENVKLLLNEYLNKESVRKQLINDYGLNLSSFTSDEVNALEGEVHRNECEIILNRMPAIDDIDSYSFYKIRSHFFIVRDYSTDQVEQKNILATILDKDYNLVGIIGTLSL